MSRETEAVEVIIVGAGLAGLSAARVVDASGLSYKILEATDRAGGKVYSGSNEQGEYALELGAQFVNKDMTELTRLIEESGMHLKRTVSKPDSVYLHAKTRTDVGAFIESVDEEIVHSETDTRLSLAQTIEDWVENEQEEAIAKSFFTEESTVSTEHILAESFLDTSERYASELDDLTHQASGPLKQVIDYLSSQLKEEIQFKHPVESVGYEDGLYRLNTGNGHSHYAEAVIFAIPPSAGSRIKFQEELKTYYEPFLTSYIDGSVIKVSLTYEHPFWHDYEMDGEAVPVEGIVYGDYDGLSVSDSSKEGDHPRLTVFIGGDLAKDWVDRSEQDRHQFVLNRMRDVLGDQVEEYLDYRESIWVDHPYYGGGYSGQVHVAGLPESPDKLRTPFQLSIFASTELAEAFPGFMEGALRSGKSAAEKIINLVDRSDKQ